MPAGESIEGEGRAKGDPDEKAQQSGGARDLEGEQRYPHDLGITRHQQPEGFRNTF